MDRSTILQAHLDLEIKLINNGTIQFRVEGRWLRAGQHALAIISEFQQPCSVDSVIERLGKCSNSKQDWINLTDTLQQLQKSGALVPPGKTIAGSSPGTYGHPSIHVRMLNDDARTSAFIAAINATVRPGDVVVEIGTGTGVLALAAAQAGAKKVYAIEASSVADSAQALFEANGLSETIELVRGWSTQVELPERCDMLVSEMVGNEPFAEQVNEITLDAKERILKEQYRLVPERIDVAFTALEAPESFLGRRCFTESSTDKWSTDYGMDFTPLCKEFKEAQLEFIRPQKARAWPQRSASTPFLSVDLYQRKFPELQGALDLEITSAGKLNALLLHYSVQLSENVSLDLAPKCAGETNHWACPLWLLPESMVVSRGDTLHIQHSRRGFGAPGTLNISLKS